MGTDQLLVRTELAANRLSSVIRIRVVWHGALEHAAHLRDLAEGTSDAVSCRCEVAVPIAMAIGRYAA